MCIITIVMMMIIIDCEWQSKSIYYYYTQGLKEGHFYIFS